MTTDLTPEGYVEWPHPSPLLDALGGFLHRPTEPLAAGFEVTELKNNARGYWN